jgi:hypothetical protein
MIKILLLFVIDYLEFVWKYFQEPIIFLTIQQCNNEQSLSSMSNIRSFLFAQYEKIVALLLNFSLITKKQQQCHLYKINLHVPIILFILKCGCITYCLLVLRKILVEFYEKQCYFILQKQTKPFVHIRSVALISKQ